MMMALPIRSPRIQHLRRSDRVMSNQIDGKSHASNSCPAHNSHNALLMHRLRHVGHFSPNLLEKWLPTSVNLIN